MPYYLGRRAFVSLGGALVAPGALSAAWAQQPVIVETASGKLRGVGVGGAVSFKGVPYAADTGGRNRFLAPRPVESWTGVRDASQFGDRSPQSRPATQANATGGPRYSENCCVLNVYTPDLNANARRPVMFYIHGGGFRGGSGDGASLDGSNLAAFGDVVVVTVNHRLNVLGYANLGFLEPDFADAANAGQLDLIAALEWVKRNIAVFGGDPGKVTVFGQSGGGSKITTLHVMPGAAGLYHRAINMSGTTAFGLKTSASREPIILEFLKNLGLGRGDLRKLQELPHEQLLAAHNTATTTLKTDDYRAVIDGRHILHAPLSPEGLAMQASMPAIMSNVATEATSYLGGDPSKLQINEAQLRARLSAQFGIDDARAAAVAEAFRQDDPRRTPGDVLVAVGTEALFKSPMRRAVEAKARLGQAPVYLEEFNWRSPIDGGVWGAPHTVDIPFAFGTVGRERYTAGAGPAAMEVSRSEMSAFVAFARTGDPNNGRLPAWRPYDLVRRPTMVIDERCRLVDDYRGGDRRGVELLPAQEAFEITGGPLFR